MAAEGVPTVKRSVNVWRFAVLAYFLVCGGPFGIEIAVTAGGPLPTILAFFIMPILWSIPQVLHRILDSCWLAMSHSTTCFIVSFP